MSVEDCRINGCSGCPHCNYEMRAIIADASAGRFEALSIKMAALTARTIRFLRGNPRPAARIMGGAAHTAPSPTTESFVARFRKGTTASTSTADRIRETLVGHKPSIAPAPAPNLRPGALIPVGAPPDLNAKIRQRKGK